MKRHLTWALALLCAPMLYAQTALPFFGPYYSFGTVTGSGVMPTSLVFAQSGAVPSNYTLDWSSTGTPTACTLQGEGSSDNIHWFSLTGSLDCTSAQMYHVTAKPVLYFRVNVTSLTGANLTVRYTRGAQ